MNIIDKILSRKEFETDPPVLIDIGASDSLPIEWQRIAKYSICIAFDADERKMGYIESEKSKFRKLYIYHSLVSDKIRRRNNFYLTNSPYCSSILEPNKESLKNWDFYNLFLVNKKVELRSTTLPVVLKELHLNKIDWFKSDSQGTDLRLFKSLGEHIIYKILVADFEPGIIDVYKKEDKLHHILAYMDNFPFFVCDMKTGGSLRINEKIVTNVFSNLQRRILNYIINKSPGWVEISYVNTFKNTKIFSKRDFLLSWVFSFIKSQLGFALEISIRGKQKFDDPIFTDLERFTLRTIYTRNILLPFIFFKKICL